MGTKDPLNWESFASELLKFVTRKQTQVSSSFLSAESSPDSSPNPLMGTQDKPEEDPEKEPLNLPLRIPKEHKILSGD
jgi:hypothetical protein